MKFCEHTHGENVIVKIYVSRVEEMFMKREFLLKPSFQQDMRQAKAIGKIY